MLSGGCFCEAVRYEATGDMSDASLCHCAICRRTTGAPVVAWFSVNPEDFRFTRGAPKTFASTSVGRRRFCGDCGAQLTFEDLRAPVVDVTTASLDDPSAAPPRDHIWATSRIPWMSGLDALPDLPRGHRSDLPIPDESAS